MTPFPPPDRRAIGVIGAYVEGWRRVLTAPAVWTSAALAILLAIGPAVWGSSTLVPDTVVGDIEHDSPIEGRTQIFGLLGTGPLPVVMQARAESTAADPTAVALTIGMYLFLWGGCLDRLARSRPIGAAAFFAACGVYFSRFLRLCVPLGLAYWALWRGFLAVHPAVSSGVLVIVNLVAGYSAARMVVEDRRSALGSLVASVRFVRRRPIAVFALYLLNILTLLAILFATGSLAGWVSSAMPPWAMFAVVSAALLVHLIGRLALAASQIVYFQHALAHAEYTAAPLPVWPDSPAAEAIENLVHQHGTRGGPGA